MNEAQTLQRCAAVIARAAFKCTLPICLGDKDAPRELASGVFLRVAGEAFVLTVRHLFERNDLRHNSVTGEGIYPENL